MSLLIFHGCLPLLENGPCSLPALLITRNRKASADLFVLQGCVLFVDLVELRSTLFRVRFHLFVGVVVKTLLGLISVGREFPQDSKLFLLLLGQLFDHHRGTANGSESSLFKRCLIGFVGELLIKDLLGLLVGQVLRGLQVAVDLDN